MSRTIWVWIGFFIMLLANSCIVTPQRNTPTAAQETEIYINKDYRFSLAYHLDWMIESESYQMVVLVPKAAQSWQPSTPSDIPKDPHVRIEMGNYIREKLGPALFPAVVDVNNLRAWLEQKVDRGEARDLSELNIHNIQAFQLTEIYESNCVRVVYWRAEGLESLVRISTGCESRYLKEFDQIVRTIRHME